MNQDEILEELKNRQDYVVKIKDPLSKNEFNFNISNRKTMVRATSLFNKEPVTIEWIRSFKHDSIFFDIGANIGQFTIFAGVISRCNIYSFEPESNNFQGLCKNIFLNNLQNIVNAFPVGISNNTKFTKLYLDDFYVGNSHNSVEYELDSNLEKKNYKFSQGIFSTTLNDLIDKWNLPIPNFIKIDVDGIENKIIEKSNNVLSNKIVESILIELKSTRKVDSIIINQLENFGFKYDNIQVRNSQKNTGFAEYLFYR